MAWCTCYSFSLLSRVCVWENSCQNTKLQKLLAPAFGSVIKNVLVRCLQHWVMRCVGVISGHPSSEEWRLSGCMVPCWATTCCNWIIYSPSVMVWPCSLFHPLPLFQECFILLARNWASSITKMCLGLGQQYCCSRCSFKKLFWKVQRLWFLRASQTHPALLAVFFFACIFFFFFFSPQISPPYCGPLA